MVLIGLADIHGNVAAIERMKAIIESADIALLLGDITNFGREIQAAQVVAPVMRAAKHTFGVSGNCDYPEVDRYLDRQGVNLHGRGLVLAGVALAGVGGSLTTPFRTPNEYGEDVLESLLHQAVADIKGHDGLPLVLVCHQPPHQTQCDRIRGGAHVGSRAVRRFIETRQPLVCLTGHIHESAAVDRLGETWIINPGMLGAGHYAYAEIGRKTVLAEIREF